MLMGSKGTGLEQVPNGKNVYDLAMNFFENHGLRMGEKINDA